MGLDLRGGSHLVLQVQLQEAIGMRCDQAIDLLTKQLREKNVGVGEISRVDDTHILVHDVTPATSGMFHDIVSNQFTDWSFSAAAGEASGSLLTLKPSVISELRQQTMDQALETINRRINALGLSEPTIAFTGRSDDEILVQLPGEGDPTRAKAVIQAGGQLELQRVADERTYTSEADALSSHGGVLPAGTMLAPGRAESSTPNTAGTTVWYVLDRVPIVTGQDLRTPPPARIPSVPGQYQVNFNLSTAAAARSDLSPNSSLTAGKGPHGHRARPPGLFRS